MELEKELQENEEVSNALVSYSNSINLPVCHTIKSGSKSQIVQSEKVIGLLYVF